ncbi:sialate:O-sulfotransferase 1-like [Daphnia carinata]|uniref:sialate:O-sulfotransferase 1-like n=1 Tax=Daphnia carinata TaxID=120202 RepID=UPI00257EC42C|nr:sialate:O-sulfotransferase 1-like [Daphnia carinata]
MLPKNLSTISDNQNLPLTTVTLTSKIFIESLANSIKQVRLQANKHDKLVSYPWKDDPTCKKFTVQLAERDSLPKWALTSFPGSGVTWTRQMIEGITGIYTGSIHEQDPPPVQLEGVGFDQLGIRDDPFCGCTIIDKDHEATITVDGMVDYFRLLYIEGYSDILRKVYDYRGVLLLRNPMDVVFTYRHWQLAGKVGTAPQEAFQGPQWKKVVEFVAYAWADHAIRWIEQIEKGTVIFYEQLLGRNASTELERLFDAMDFKPSPLDTERMRCTLDHRDRTDHKRLNKSWIPLEEEQRLLFIESIHRVQQSLRRRKWPQLPVHLYDLHGLYNQTIL